jgi:hypothetical protein
MTQLSQKTSGKPFPLRLFTLATLGFVLSIAQLLFLPANTSTSVYILQFCALILFLLVLYVADKYYRNTEKLLSALHARLAAEKEVWEGEKEQLTEKLADYEQKENEDKRFASYQEKMLKKIFNDPKSINDRHHLLHLLSETFRAGAAILYKETEPLGHFVVEQSYALPEDFQPKKFVAGEGFNGQVVLDQTPMVVYGPDADMLPVTSGLGQSESVCLYLLPVIVDGRCLYLIEMVTFHEAEIDKMWNAIATQLVDMHIF